MQLLENILEKAVDGSVYLVQCIVENVTKGKSFRSMENTYDGEYDVIFPGRAKCSALYKQASQALREAIGSDIVSVNNGIYIGTEYGVEIDNDVFDTPTFERWLEMVGVKLVNNTPLEEVNDKPEPIDEPEQGDIRYNAVINQSSMTILMSNGQWFNIQDDFTHYEELKELVRSFGDARRIIELCDIAGQVTSTLDDLRIEDGVLYYKDIEVSGKMVPRILHSKQADQGYVDALENFFGRLVQNPYKETVDSLYRFLSANAMPLTSDGHFLAFKRVRGNYRDVHSGQFDNSVGQVVEVTWQQVDLDNDRTCSYGLHVCSQKYLGSFSGSRVMVCKVDPADVGACPRDYADSKLRVRKYEVIGEIDNGFSMEDMETYFHPDQGEALKDAPIPDYSELD